MVMCHSFRFFTWLDFLAFFFFFLFSLFSLHQKDGRIFVMRLYNLSWSVKKVYMPC